MSWTEILELFYKRFFNIKTNNYIFTGVEDLGLINSIPFSTSIFYPDNDINIESAINIKIDLNDVELKNILTYILVKLRDCKCLDETLDWSLEFNSKFDLLKFQGILHRFNIAVQLIVYNVEKLSLEEQFLFNELYYFNSMYFNVNSFIKGEHFQSYFLNDNRVLDDRENYEKIKLVRRQIDGDLKRSLLKRDKKTT